MRKEMEAIIYGTGLWMFGSEVDLAEELTEAKYSKNGDAIEWVSFYYQGQVCNWTAEEGWATSRGAVNSVEDLDCDGAGNVYLWEQEIRDPESLVYNRVMQYAKEDKIMENRSKELEAIIYGTAVWMFGDYEEFKEEIEIVEVYWSEITDYVINVKFKYKGVECDWLDGVGWLADKIYTELDEVGCSNLKYWEQEINDPESLAHLRAWSATVQ